MLFDFLYSDLFGGGRVMRCGRVLKTRKLYTASKSVCENKKINGQPRSGVSQDIHRAAKLSGRFFMAKLGDGGVTGRA